MSGLREFKESPIKQGEDEQIAYYFSSTPWGSNPSNVSAKIYDSHNVDKSSTCLSGTCSVNGDVITIPVVKALVVEETYRLEVKFTCSGNIFEAYCVIAAEK